MKNEENQERQIPHAFRDIITRDLYDEMIYLNVNNFHIYGSDIIKYEKDPYDNTPLTVDNLLELPKFFEIIQSWKLYPENWKEISPEELKYSKYDLEV